MKKQEALATLESLHNEKMYKHHQKNGVGDKQYGAKLGDIRALAKKIKTNHSLALELWETENLDARMLAILILDGKQLSIELIDHLVKTLEFAQVADWLYSYVIKVFPENEDLRQKWMHSSDIWAARMGWSLTSGCVVRHPDRVDFKVLIDRIEKEMGQAAPEVQWTMNSTLAQIGIHYAEHRDRCLSIGEKLGVFRDFPTSKGCTSPFAPIWIHEMVSRQN